MWVLDRGGEFDHDAASLRPETAGPFRSMTDPTSRIATRLGHGGRTPKDQKGAVNPPVYRASTVLFDSLADYEEADHNAIDRFYYGRISNPNADAFERAMAELEGGYRAVAVSSGLAAITVPLLASLKAGDHVLMVDTAYPPTRRFCDRMLADLGVATTYYDPRIGAGIAALIRPETKVLYMESPGSGTFEVQDVPALVTVAQRHGLTTMIDNTWSGSLLFHPIAHGVDIAIQAATKYIAGHADASLGVVVARDKPTFLKVKRTAVMLGNCAGPDDLFLGLRGLRTLEVRLRRHEENGLKVAHWLQDRPEVTRVLYPALPEDPGHTLWQRDFSGASSLFSIVLKPVPQAAVHRMIDGLALFGIGASWGGFESLILPAHPDKLRTAVPWTDPGPVVRLHIGLEDPEDLIADLAAGFDRLNAVAAEAGR